MPDPADVNVKRQYGGAATDLLRNLVEQHNALVATVRALTAKLDADAGVGDANYAATLTDEGVADAPAQLHVI